MKTKAKIVMMGINFVCILMSLLFPSDITPFAILPVFITSASWTFLDNNKIKNSTLFLVAATIIGVVFLLLGFTSNIVQDDINTSRYSICIKDGIAFIGGECISYKLLFFLAVIGFIFLTVPEIYFSSKPRVMNDDYPIPINHRLEDEFKKK